MSLVIIGGTNMFKSDWEIIYDDNSPSPEDIQSILKYIYGDEQHVFKIAKQGCANCNIVVTNPSGHKNIVRIYCRDPKAMIIEKNVMEKVSGVISTPVISDTGTVNGMVYSVQNYIDGSLLRDVLLTQQVDVHELMQRVGEVLGLLANWRFGQSGFFDESLRVQSQALNYHDYAHQMLDHLVKDEKLSVDIVASWKVLIDQLKQFFPPKEDDYLVHGDFDPSNIIVDEVNGHWTVSGILDWEFAHAGSQMQDIANMLRYQDKVSKEFRRGFVHGLQQRIILPEHWSTTVDLCNVLALLDCLALRVDVDHHPNRYHDVTNLLSHLYCKLQGNR